MAGTAARRRRLSRALAGARPKTAKALWHFVRAAYGLAVPRRAVCPGHAAPFEYLKRAILEPGRDLVVWASRGGAKTELGSVAAHLDSIFRPGCQTRILGGSLEQSEKMYKYLGRKMGGVWSQWLAREPTMRRMVLANGYFPIDDAIAQKRRASREAWEAEMLCLRPRADRLVFADFDPRQHVAPTTYRPDLPLYRALDFGYANPFVCLWIQVEDQRGMRNTEYGTNGRKDKKAAADVDLSGVRVRVIGEYVERERPIGEHVRVMRERDPGPVSATFADPAGWQRSDVTGTGPCEELARAGLRVRTPRAGILEGVELVRRLLKPRAAGAGPGLVVDPSCRWLIRAMQEYHWDATRDGRLSERPAKDGSDHPVDALRYLVTGLFLRPSAARRRQWW